jgi:hypothetical protein
VTLLLAHPEAEDLGRFVEGTLADHERAAIVDHIADCDDCRMLIVDAAEFIEPANVESHGESAVEVQHPDFSNLKIGQEFKKAPVHLTIPYDETRSPGFPSRPDAPVAGRDWGVVVQKPEKLAYASVSKMVRAPRPASRAAYAKWWMRVAASLILVAAIGGLTYRQLRDPEADVKKDYAKLSSRPLEARLSGYPYVRRVVNRGEEDKEIQLEIVQGAAANLMELHGDDAKTLHAKGIGFLLADGNENRKKSIAPLQAAAAADPDNAKYQSDLAAALIAAAGSDQPMLDRALAACDRALRIDPNSPDALFNRAVALQALERPEALAAYERYLRVDSTSPWADEARKNAELLRSLP